jgi:hypothetical protein
MGLVSDPQFLAFLVLESSVLWCQMKENNNNKLYLLFML